MIIITGNKGFIGSRLAAFVQKKYKKEKVFVLDKPKFDLVTGKNLDKLPKKPRLVFHLAAATDTSKGGQKCNNIGTKNLLGALSEIGPKTHLIYTSSQAIFSGRVNTQKLIDNQTEPNTNNEYGKTKLEAEGLLLKAAKKQGFKLTIIRLPTTWGDNPRKNSFLNFLKGLVKSNSIISRLNWPGKIGLLYVDDAAKFILDSADKSPQIVSIAAQNLTLAQIFEILTQKSSKKYTQLKLPNFIWDFARSLRPYLKYLSPFLPAGFYNYFWRASIVVDSPLWCNENINGVKFAQKDVSKYGFTSLSRLKLQREDQDFLKNQLCEERDQECL